jgi:hypothetical protein
MRHLHNTRLRRLLKRRWLVAMLVGGVLFSSVYAFAATLGVSSNTLSAGNQAVTTCTASVNASYTIAYDSTLPGYRVSGVNLNNLLAACVGKTITVDLTGAANASLVQVTYLVTGADAPTPGNKTITVPASPSIAASLVTGISVALTG